MATPYRRSSFPRVRIVCAFTLLLVAVGWFGSGCSTSRPGAAVAEVSLPAETQPVMSQPQVVTPPAWHPAPTNPVVVVTNTPAPTPPPAATNLITKPLYVPPPSGWVPLDTWAVASGFGKARRIGANQYAVSTDSGVLVVQPGSQIARWDGTQVWLGYAPRFAGGQPQMHALDLRKVLEPLLYRPAFQAKTDRVLVLDPGHGGIDGGTRGLAKDHLEKTFALDWAQRVETLLRTNGWKVYLTRARDQDLSLTNRLLFADSVNADLFVSLHFNGLNNNGTHSGIETFCLTPMGMPSSVTRGYEDNPQLVFPNNTFDRENLNYAYRLHRELLATTKAADGGVRHARFISVLRGQRRPAVLIEGGFLTNADEGRRIATAAYRQKLAEAVARALR